MRLERSGEVLPEMEEERAFRTLHTLLRGGYTADAAAGSAEQGIVLSPPEGGPALLLQPDGTLRPAGNSGAVRAKTARSPEKGGRTGFWGKRLLLLIGLIAFWILSVILTTSILEGM